MPDKTENEVQNQEAASKKEEDAQQEVKETNTSYEDRVTDGLTSHEDDDEGRADEDDDE
jgi:hypothetical protein